MQVTTIAEARALVGRTFERDGETRTPTFVGSHGGVFQRIHGTHNLLWDDLRQFNDWLSGATEVTEGSVSE